MPKKKTANQKAIDILYAQIEALTKHQKYLEGEHAMVVDQRTELQKQLFSAQSRIHSREEQIKDINQWTELLLANRSRIRPRVMWSMIADINNRTTD